MIAAERELRQTFTSWNVSIAIHWMTGARKHFIECGERTKIKLRWKMFSSALTRKRGIFLSSLSAFKYLIWNNGGIHYTNYSSGMRDIYATGGTGVWRFTVNEFRKLNCRWEVSPWVFESSRFRYGNLKTPLWCYLPTSPFKVNLQLCYLNKLASFASTKVSLKTHSTYSIFVRKGWKGWWAQSTVISARVIGSSSRKLIKTHQLIRKAQLATTFSISPKTKGCKSRWRCLNVNKILSPPPTSPNSALKENIIPGSTSEQESRQQAFILHHLLLFYAMLRRGEETWFPAKKKVMKIHWEFFKQKIPFII